MLDIVVSMRKSPDPVMPFALCCRAYGCRRCLRLVFCRRNVPRGLLKSIPTATGLGSTMVAGSLARPRRPPSSQAFFGPMSLPGFWGTDGPCFALWGWQAPLNFLACALSNPMRRRIPTNLEVDLFWYTRQQISPSRPLTTYQNHKMAAIGSLIFCTDCGNLLPASMGSEKNILHCDCCGAENRG